MSIDDDLFPAGHALQLQSNAGQRLQTGVGESAAQRDDLREAAAAHGCQATQLLECEEALPDRRVEGCDGDIQRLAARDVRQHVAARLQDSPVAERIERTARPVQPQRRRQPVEIDMRVVRADRKMQPTVVDDPDATDLRRTHARDPRAQTRRAERFGAGVRESDEAAPDADQSAGFEPSGDLMIARALCAQQ